MENLKPLITNLTSVNDVAQRFLKLFNPCQQDSIIFLDC